MPGTSAFAEARAGWRAVANQGDSSPADLSIFCLRSCAPRRLPAAGAPCVARFPHPWSPAHPAKHTYIDAFNGKTVTRETLLRYTFKSHLVNVLIRGFLWKNLPPGLNLTSECHPGFEAQKQGTCHRAPIFYLLSMLFFNCFSSPHNQCGLSFVLVGTCRPSLCASAF